MKQKATLLLAVVWIIFASTPDNSFAQKKKKSRDTDTVVKVEPWKVDTLIQPIDLSRRLFTDKIEKTLDAIDGKDGAVDGTVQYRDETTTRLFTQAVMADAPRMIIMIENLDMGHNETIKYYKVLEEKMEYMARVPWDTLPAAYFSDDINNFRELTIAQYRGDVLSFVQQHRSVTTLNNLQVMERNMIAVHDMDQSKAVLYKALASSYPELILNRLPAVKDEPYADTVLADVAKAMPAAIIWSAGSQNALGQLIRRSADPLVQTLVRITESSKKPNELLPFLGPINRGEKSIGEAEGYLSDERKYFQALVDLTISNEQVSRGDIDHLLTERIRTYADKINDERLPDDQRFAMIRGMRDVDYYMLIVQGKDLLSSNTLVYGVFPLLHEQLGRKSGAELLLQVHHYKFRPFLRLCAENNTLPDFMKTMTRPEKQTMVKLLFDSLEKGNIADYHEALSVAGFYRYLNDEDASDQLRSDVYEQYDRIKKIPLTQKEAYGKGILTYGIFQNLFPYKFSADNKPFGGREDFAQIGYENFINEQQEVIEMVLFYGDQNGRSNYNSFINEIKANSAWRTEEAKQWVRISSTGQSNIIIYANKPGNDSQSVAAVHALTAHLKQSGKTPVVLYHASPVSSLKHSIAAMPSGVRVLMAACSLGEDNLAAALQRNPGLHIISGRLENNSPVEFKVFAELNKQLAYKRDLRWADMWKDLQSYYTDINPADKASFENFSRPDKDIPSLFGKLYLEGLNSLRK